MPSGSFLPVSKCGARITIDNLNEEIHKGNRYTCLFLETIASTAGTSIIALTTNSEKELHLVFSLESDKAGEWQLSEGAVVSAGTAITAYNNDRKSTNTCDCVIVANPTVATVGTILGYHIIGSTTGGASKSGGSAVANNEWIAKQNTTYLLKFTAAAPSAKTVQGLYFYEGEVVT